MLVGDQIVAYDGRRVFHIRELTEVLLQGEPGAPVIVDIVRDGQAMQLVLPRGPLGIIAAAGPVTTFSPIE
jgi:S1-C subfamily serine protease